MSGGAACGPGSSPRWWPRWRHRRGRRQHGAGVGRHGGHHRLVRAGEPQQRQGPGRVQPVHRRRRRGSPSGPATTATTSSGSSWTPAAATTGSSRGTRARSSTCTTGRPPTARAILQWTDHNGTNQQFRLADSDGGYVRLINRNSNKAVEVQSASTADGANVVQYSDWGGSNQQWQLVRVGRRRHRPRADDRLVLFRRRTAGRRPARWRTRGRGGSRSRTSPPSSTTARQLVYATTHDTGNDAGDR